MRAAGWPEVHAQLRVVVARRHRQAEIRVAGDGRPQDVVDVAPPAGQGDVQAGNSGDRAFDQRAALEQVEVRVSVQLVPQLARAHLDQAAGEVAVPGAEVAWDEVDRFQQIGIHRAGERSEVEQQRNRLAVQIDQRIARLAAADH